MKLIFVATKHNPDVAVFDEADQFATDETGLKLNETDFHIAIAVNDAVTGDFKHSAKYVDWMAIVWRSENGAYRREAVTGMHPCTQEEYSKFYKPTPAAEIPFQRFKK